MNNEEFFNIRNIVYDKQLQDFSVYFIISPKGIGKTYSAIHFCIEEWEKYQRGFAYCFRTMTEAQAFYAEFDGELDNEKYYRLGVNVFTKGGTRIGVIGSITTHHKIKNNPLIYNLIFDEIIPQTRYVINQEYRKWWKIIDNLARLKKKFKTIMLANPNTAHNTFFIKWKIYDFKKKSIRIGKEIFILFIKQGEYVKTARENSVGFSLAKYDSELRDMAIGGKFSLDDTRQIEWRDNMGFEDYFYVLILEGMKFVVGENKEKDLAFDYATDAHCQILEKVVITSIDALNESNFNMNDDLEEFIEPWKQYILAGKIKFRDFEIKELICKYITLLTGKFKL